MLTTELTKKCKQFVISHWGKDGLEQIKERPVTWVRYRLNPQLRLLRRKKKDVPLITLESHVNRIKLALSTEHEKAGR